VYTLPGFNDKKIYLCDPIMIAIAMKPLLIKKYYHKHLKIELEGLMTKGSVIIDW
jgi:inosine-uridine nucleoside N-ribohydrolase